MSRKRYKFNSTNLYLERFRLEPVTYCRPEPPCVVTDIPKRVKGEVGVVMFNCVFITFACGIPGQVWYLIVSIPDLCHLSYF